VALSEDDFFQLCQDNRDLRLERSPGGEVLIMPPTGGETGRRSLRIAGQLDAWTEIDGRGVAFDSSTGFLLPSGAIRSPDAAWMPRERWESVPSAARERFVPDFVIELRSPSDRLADLQAKIAEYLAAGATLGWLIDPVERRAHVYASGSPLRVLDAPPRLSGEPVLPGFVLDLTAIWPPVVAL
jgi:Uma2 family endonuclease